MSGINKDELELLGYKQVYDYTSYSHENHINVIPKKDFNKLVSDTFKTIVEVLKETYGPYGSTVIISEQSETTTTKDGYNVFGAINFSHQYKRMVYLAIQKIIERVNRNVGDGTTSCILLAEKMFNKMNKIIKTSEDNRNMLNALNVIEKDFQDMSVIDKDKTFGIIKSLNKESLINIIKLSGNYDDELTNVLLKALSPTYSSDSNNPFSRVESVRNVVVEKESDYRSASNVSYEVDYLPGDYRVRVNMDVDIALTDFSDKTDIKIVLYDHAFGPADWNNFIKDYDDETKVLIIARDFTKTFMANEFTLYSRKRALMKQPVNIVLSSIGGPNVQDELKDLAALLRTEVRDLHAGAVNHEDIVTATVQMYKGNALCFYNVTPPTEYIHKVEREMKKDTTHSYIIRKSYMNRIKALSLISKDTLITVKAGTSLELKMINDKIDDCVSIVDSALTSGVVPNLFLYATRRLKRIGTKFKETDKLVTLLSETISESLEGLFNDIWVSKYGSENTSISDAKYCEAADRIYRGFEIQSYDVINEQFVNTTDLPTSTQYDLEVVIAAISIVKYLLTSRAFVFDAHLMTPVGDQGHYQKF